MNHARVLLVSVLGLVLVLGAVTPVRGMTVWFVADLTGAQEVPPNLSTATGRAVLVYDDVTKVLSYEVTFSGLSSAETAAHIHGPAPPGISAAVLFALPPGSPKVGSVLLNPTQEGYLRDELLYVNIHSTTLPGGEIRGQIVLLTVGGEVMPVSVLELLAPYVVAVAMLVVGVVGVLRGRALRVPLGKPRQSML